MKNIAKAAEALGDELVVKILSLDEDELTAFEEKLDAIIEERQKKIADANKMSREELVALYEGFGYEVKPGMKFWKIGGLGRGRGLYGLEVGQYTHSCHIDTTELIVLLVVDGTNNYVESYADLWLSGPIVV